jgi:lysozyme
MAWLLLAPLLLACGVGDGDGDGDGDGVGVGGGETARRRAPIEAVASSAEALTQCAAQAVEGVDVFDDQGAIDWAAVADGGVAFAMIKATQGTYDTQSTFAANWAGAARAGVRRGAYHFFDPTEDGAAQARRFLAVVGPLSAGDLPPMLDVECPDGDADCLGTGASGQAAPAAIAARMGAWLAAVEGATGRTPLLYTFSSYFASSGVDAGGLGGLPLFLAYPTSGSCFGVPAPWTHATLWQYSWTGVVPGVSTAVDRDRFLGSPADLAALAGVPMASLSPPLSPPVSLGPGCH